jgi:hypothetical protein
LFPSSHSAIVDRLDAEGVPVTWGTILAASEADGALGVRISGAEIVSLATAALSQSQGTSNDLLLELAIANPMDEEELHRRLLALADAERSDRSIEIRKIRLLQVQDALDCLPSDPIYGLLALSEFWSGCGYPPDSPHAVQGVGGDVTSPSDYYTERHFSEVLAVHREWLDHEREALSKSATPSWRAIP